MLKDGYGTDKDILVDHGAVRKTRAYKQKSMEELKKDLTSFKAKEQ